MNEMRCCGAAKVFLWIIFMTKLGNLQTCKANMISSIKLWDGNDILRRNLRRKNSLLNQTFDNVLVSGGCWQFALKVYLCCKLCSWRGSVGSKGGTNIPSFFWPLLTRQFNRKLDLGWNHFSDKDCILKMTKNTFLWVSQKLAQNNKVLLFHLTLNKLEIKVQMAPRQSVGWG